MPKDVKLQALRKTYEIEEQRALEEKQRVENVVEERRQIVEDLHRKCDELDGTLKRLRTKERGLALSSGDTVQLSAISRYEKRVKSELDEISRLAALRKKEFEQALERLQIAEQDLIDARIEKKKIEKFMDNRQHSERVVDAAIEEALTDEMNFYRHRK